MSGNIPCKDENRNILLVEGLDDCHVILALCKAHDVPQKFGLYECGSYEKVLKRLNAQIAQPDPPGRSEIIGVVVDADENLTERWKSIRDKLKNHNYELPEKPNPSGSIIESTSKPKLGIWLMPNNQIGGMLEDFCIKMIEENQIDIVKKVLEEVKSVCTYKENHYSKAIIHTYLAWQDEPGKPLGQSITSRVLRPNTSLAHSFANWPTKLFS